MTSLDARRSRQLTVVKLGGELLEEASSLRRLARTLAEQASRKPLVVVHGGGREVDRDLAKHGIPKQSIDGLRITDIDTLNIVIGVLAGRVNTRLVSTMSAAGSSAVGLTGADASLVPVRQNKSYRAANGKQWDLGYVGHPYSKEPPKLLLDLLEQGYTPVIASIGAGTKGQLYNVNADTLASHLAVRLKASRLVIAGSTNGVLTPLGKTIPTLAGDSVTRVIDDGSASAGMIAKLLAGREALRNGVGTVAIINGNNARRGLFERAVGGTVLTQ